MVPFSFRVLHAELPIYLGKYQDSLNRLYYLLDVTTKVGAISKELGPILWTL